MDTTLDTDNRVHLFFVVIGRAISSRFLRSHLTLRGTSLSDDHALGAVLVDVPGDERRELVKVGGGVVEDRLGEVLWQEPLLLDAVKAHPQVFRVLLDHIQEQVLEVDQLGVDRVVLPGGDLNSI